MHIIHSNRKVATCTCSARGMFRRLLGCIAVGILVLSSPATAQVTISDSFSVRFPHESFDVARTLDRAYIGTTFLGEVHVVDLATNDVIGVMDGRGGGYASLSPNEEWVIVSAMGRDHHVYRTSDNLREATIQVGDFNGELSLGIGWSPDSAYAFILRVESSPSEQSVLYKIDASNFQMVSQVEVGGLTIFARGFLHIAPGGSRALIIDNFVNPNVMRVVDTDAMSVLGSVDVGPLPGVPVFDSSGEHAWIPSSGNDQVAVLDMQTLQVVRQFDTADNPGALSFDEATGRLALLAAGGTVQLFDADSGTLLASVVVPGGNSVTLQPYLGTALVTVGGSDELVVIDFNPASPTFGTILQRLTLPGCAGSCQPTGVALHPDGLRGYTLSFNRQRIDVLDLPTPDVSLYLIPQQFAYNAGDLVRFEARVTNHTGVAQDITGWIDVIKPNGNPFPANPVAGPASKTLGPGRTITRTVGYRIGATVPPSGPYQTAGRLGMFPAPVTFSSSFPFFVE